MPSDLATIVEFRLAMFDDMSGAEAGPTPRPESLRRDNERWVAEHLGRDFFAWIAELDGRPVPSAGVIWFAHPPGPLNPIGRIDGLPGRQLPGVQARSAWRLTLRRDGS